MKRLMKLVLFCTILGYIFNACTSSVDELFDDSAANRVTKAINEYKEVLVAAKNGWLMEYYAEGNGKDKMGGINMFITFNDNGRAVIFSDSPVTDIISKTTYPAGTKVESAYEVLADQIVMLTFNSHNPIIHYYSEPSSSDVNGYEGDYEFLFRQVSKDEIILTGKKIGLTIRMTAIPENKNTEDILQSINDIKEKISLYPYSIYMNGDSIGNINYTHSNNNNMFKMDIGDKSIKQNFTITTSGIRFYEPVRLGNEEIATMSWDSINYTLTSDNTEKEITFIQTLPDYFKPYSYFLGDFTMTHKLGSVDITIEENVKDKSYKVKGLFEGLEPVFIYNKGRIEFVTHAIKDYDENRTISFLPRDKASYRTTKAGAGGFFEADSTEEGKYNLEDNGVWGGYIVSGFCVYLVDKKTGTSSSYKELKTYKYDGPISLIKK